MNDLAKALASGSSRSEVAMEVWNLIQPNRNSLNKLKRISIRSKSWFSELSFEQRRFMELVIVVVEKIRSRLLLRLLAPLVMKLLTAIGRSFKVPLGIECGDPMGEEAMKGALSLMDEAAHVMMKSVAKKICLAAQKWGNKPANQWMKDAGFIKYLIMMSLPQNANPLTFTISLGQP